MNSESSGIRDSQLISLLAETLTMPLPDTLTRYPYLMPLPETSPARSTGALKRTIVHYKPRIAFLDDSANKKSNNNL